MIREARSGTGTHFSQESETFASKVALLTAGLLMLPVVTSIAKRSPYLSSSPFLPFHSQMASSNQRNLGCPSTSGRKGLGILGKMSRWQRMGNDSGGAKRKGQS